jgi:FkbM family methyltransferase
MLKFVRESVLKVSRSLGYDIVPLRKMKERDFALHLRELLASQKIDCVIDVGAHIGQYRDFLREQVLYDGPIVSFEPVGQHIRILRARSRVDRDWHVEGYALGSRSGAMPVKVSTSDNVDTEVVAVRTLDQILPTLRRQLGFARPYLKIDTQGSDIEVLHGAEESLPSICALQSGASVVGIYRGMPSRMDMIRHLNERGFEITGLYPTSRDRSLRLIGFDCVMINVAMAVAARSKSLPT